ncbi:Fe-S protein assembly co-chaperone HscB [Orrella sp. JC864]|uniref:Fe-S protein assembly co-chaperone HscB n=1 Tax=Orrella sp. JC864 TaxID=3120298 RepID=UPI0030094CE6
MADDHFSLFGLPARYAIDPVRLEQAWREVSARVHPDRYATASAAEKRVAMQWSARANEAYRVLRDPLQRARYLCETRGVDLQTESNTAMAPAFLMQQMQWREALDEARDSGDAGALRALHEDLQGAQAQMQAQVAELLDAQDDPRQAGQRVREWMFLERLAQELRQVQNQNA